jgi:hypothetical protein
VSCGKNIVINNTPPAGTGHNTCTLPDVQGERRKEMNRLPKFGQVFETTQIGSKIIAHEGRNGWIFYVAHPCGRGIPDGWDRFFRPYDERLSRGAKPNERTLRVLSNYLNEDGRLTKHLGNLPKNLPRFLK